MSLKLPLVSGKNPTTVKLEKGKKYFWCKCGRSNNQPYCDGSHRGTGINPLAFTAEKTEKKALCLCKATDNAPFCDGSHAKLSNLNIGDEVENSVAKKKLIATPTSEEPSVAFIHELAKNGLKNIGHHGEMAAMGVPSKDLPKWSDIQILTAQMAKKPLNDGAPVKTSIIIGPKSQKPLELDIPLLVSDMSYGALSEEAKISLSKGAELAGTGICSGEGGMLEEERMENSRYFYELASAKFGWQLEKVKKVQAFHFKGGQGAKTGTGGHLPGEKVHGKIAKVRNLSEGEDAISPSTFHELITPNDFKDFSDEVREVSGGIPIGFKLSANHIENDIDFALEAGADYIILDGRGGGTGAAPLIFRDNISVPTIPALARARKHLDKTVGREVTLIITGGLRVPEDFVKAIALGADAIALSNSAMQAIGCIAARMCDSNNCPTGIATQKQELRSLININIASERLSKFFNTSVHLMKILCRACGHDDISKLSLEDLTTWKQSMADLSGVSFGGVKSF